MTNLTRYAFALALALTSIALQAQCVPCDCTPANTISGNITSNTTLSGCNCIEGYVFVEPGVTLTIDAGTVIKGIIDDNITTGDQASALIVARGATIEANGTSAAPIVFTAETDDVCDPDDIAECTQSLWGGLIVLGSAPLNSSGELPGTSPVEDLIEGIPNDEEFARFGGTDPNDDSGNLNYISIRHGGSTLDADNEINGLTLGGVGAGTEIDFIEVFANSDDGVEWFGGTVNVKHVVVTNAGDDSFDYDQGSTFNVQFAVSIGSDDCGSNRPGEHDGSVEAATAFPFANPAFSNVTYIGKSGFAAQPENDIILFRDAAGGFYQNSVFCNS
ncbi:MAG: T9SS C-terminal target domain-containing protein, partial [Bacteroidota bacterium]